jgi:YGGT family
MATYNAPSTKVIFTSTQIVWFVLGCIEILLALRFIMKLLGAASAPFTSFIYTTSSIFVSPFATVFHTGYTAGAIFEWTTILAGFIYAIIAYGIINLFLMGLDVSVPEAASLLQE